MLSQELIGLIEHDGLYACEFELCFVEELQQSAWSGDDDIWVDGERLKLSLVSVSSQDQTVPQVNLMQVALKY